MKKLLLFLVLTAVAISGCMEKSPSGTGTSGAEKSVGDLKTLSIKSADNLNTYCVKSSVNQTMKLNAVGINATPANATTIIESTEALASVNLSGYQASASSSTMSVVQKASHVKNTRTTHADVYQIGNSTYVKKDKGNWIHQLDSRSTEEFWGQVNNNYVRNLVNTINKSQVEIISSENVEGFDTYKLKILNGSADYGNLYNTAFGIAAQLAQYPKLIPSINRTELNMTGVVDKFVWISKDSYLPLKYQSSMSFKMTPVIVGGMDSKTGKIKRFNHSVRFGDVSVDLNIADLYYDFNKSIEINLPEEARKTIPITSSPARDDSRQ